MKFGFLKISGVCLFLAIWLWRTPLASFSSVVWFIRLIPHVFLRLTCKKPCTVPEKYVFYKYHHISWQLFRIWPLFYLVKCTENLWKDKYSQEWWWNDWVMNLWNSEHNCCLSKGVRLTSSQVSPTRQSWL